MSIFMANAESIGYRVDTQTKYTRIAENDLIQIASNFKKHRNGKLTESHLGFTTHLGRATNRLDSRHFDPRISKIINKLMDCPHVELGDVILASVEGNAPRKYVVDDGVPVITIENIVKRHMFYFIELTDVRRITRKAHERAKVSQIRSGEILMAITGATIGKVAVAPQGLEEANICGDIVKIEIDRQKLNPHYIAAFLSSSYGQPQIFRHIYGSTNMHLDTDGIKSILIPLHAKQEEIGRRLCEIEEAYQKSSKLAIELSAEMSNFMKSLV